MDNVEEIRSRLKNIMDEPRNLKPGYIEETGRMALAWIDKLMIHTAIRADELPTADEALAIINENKHHDYAWAIQAVTDCDFEVGRRVMSYPELIGTAMYYRAMAQREEPK
jgi:hypothetical protein